MTVTCLTADIGTCVGADAMGTYDRSIDRTFTYDVAFTRLASGDKTFDTNALVDGGIIQERDSLTGKAPEPVTLVLLAAGLLGLGFGGDQSRSLIRNTSSR